MQNINLDKKNIIKFFLLSVFFLIVFYFFIFKNIILYNELNENITNEAIKLEKLKLEKDIISKSLSEKEKQFEILKKQVEKNLEQTKEKENFSRISEILSYINKNIENNKLELVSFARSTKNNKTINISLNLKGKEQDIKKFIRDIEDGGKNISLTQNYFKFWVEKGNLISVKISLTCILGKKMEEDLKNNNEIIKENLIQNNIFLDESSVESEENSFMRIGNKKFYRNFTKDKTEKENQEKGGDKK
ncbi:MAG: hypothetical protein KGV57_01525 [Fusobacterium sp.]|nr:hypothetical protein [Fusobacterium sp.]